MILQGTKPWGLGGKGRVQASICQLVDKGVVCTGRQLQTDLRVAPMKVGQDARQPAGGCAFQRTQFQHALGLAAGNDVAGLIGQSEQPVGIIQEPIPR